MSNTEMLELIKKQLAGGQSLEATVSELARNDPELAPVVELLAKRQETLAEENLLAEQEDHATEWEAERHLRSRELRTHFEDITAALNALRDQLARVAGALGACPACFGDDAGCQWCRGRGRPGFMPPEPESFAEIVLPAVRLHVRLHGRRNGLTDQANSHERSN
ncbi:hypothetical protein ACWEOO_26130 [Kribbella sp. NPDC004138]